MIAFMKRRVYELVSLLLCLIVGIPVYQVVIGSFKDQAGASELSLSLPEKWRIFENYSQVFVEGRIALAFFNSSFVTLISVAVILAVCSTSAYVLQRRKNRFTAWFEKMLIVGMILPGSIITSYKLLYEMHLTGAHSYWGVIFLYISGAYAFTTFLYISFFHGIPRELDEAGIIDGAQGLRLFREVIVPLLAPINATAFIINFMSLWNDFGTALYFLNNPDRYTLGLTVYFFYGQRSAEWNLVFADLVLISLPVILAYAFLQKYIVSGLTAGAVKG